MTVSKIQKARAIEAANSELGPSKRERQLLKDRLALVVGTSALSAGALATTSASAAAGASGSVAAGGTKGIVGTLSLAGKIWVTKIAAGALITGAGVYGAVHVVESYDVSDSRTGDGRADEKRGVKDGAAGSEAKTSGVVIEDEQRQPETHSLRASQASVRVSPGKMDLERANSTRGVASVRGLAKTDTESEKTKDDLMEEVSLLESIELGNLRSYESGRALAEHARRFSHGQLAHERRRLLQARRCLLARDRVTADLIVEKSATLSDIIAEACGR